jgi:hypothetical protein
MKVDDLYALASLFEKYAQTPQVQQDPELKSPNIIVEPLNPVISKAIKLLQRMDPNYFVGARKIVITMSPNYGFVQSGPGKDPTVININLSRIISESGGNLASPEAILAAATVIGHEIGHIKSYNQSQGFIGGEGPAEAEEARVRHWIESNMNRLQDIVSSA